MFWATHGVTLGGVTVGLSIVLWTLIRWWHSPGRHWKRLVVPFVPLMAYGTLLVLSTGGLLGKAAGTTLWGSNRVGNVALVAGVGGDSPNIPRPVDIVLTDGGHVIVILMTIGLIAVAKYKKSVRTWELLLPVVAGISLGLSPGIAGLAAQVLGPAADTLGGTLSGLIT